MSQSDDHRLLDALYADDVELSADDAQEFEALSDTLAVMRQLDDVDPPPFLSTRILAEAREMQAKPTGWARLLKLVASPMGGLAATAALAAVVVVATLPTMGRMAEPTADFEESEMVAQKAAAPAVKQPASVAPKLEVAADEAKDRFDEDELGNLNAVREGNAPARVRRSFPRDAEEVDQVPGGKAAGGGRAFDKGRGDSAFGSGAEAEPAAEVPVETRAKTAKKKSRSRAAARPPAPVALPEKEMSREEKPGLAKTTDLAATFLAAAEAELRAGRPGAARRVLARGVEQTRGQSDQAKLYLRWAELELEDRQPTVARGYLEQAMRVKGFQDHKRAYRLEVAIKRLESELNPPK